MIKLKQLLTEGHDLQAYAPKIMAANTFTEFLNSLVGTKMKALLDAASFARLYIANKYGFNNTVKSDKQVLLNQLLSSVADYINFKKIHPLRTKLDAMDAEEKKTPEYQEFHRKKMELARAAMFARRENDKEKEAQIQIQKNALHDPSSYSKNMEDMQTLVQQFHNSNLSAYDILPSETDSDDDKKRLAQAEAAFNALKSASN